MSEKRLDYDLLWNNYYQVIELDNGDTDYLRRLSPTEIIKRLNEQQATISKLEEEKGYWKSKAMTLLFQVRRLTPRMSAKEVIEFGKELEDE